jgi:serine protease Do
MKKYAERILLVLILVAMLSRPLWAQSSQDTIETTLPRIVKIYGAGGLRHLKSYSTGFLISSTGHVATVWSHVLDTGEVSVVLDDGRRFEAEVLGAEPQLDLAVLKLNSDNLELAHFDLSKAASASVGTRILGFSNMFKVAAGDEPVSVLHGVISARTKLSARRGAFEIPYDGPVYVVDAVTNNSGAGGGVITTRDGKLLGMIGKELRNTQSNTWINYAIPVTELRDVIEQIISGRYVAEKNPEKQETPNRYQPIDFGLVMIPDVLFRTPAYVDSVLPHSPAAKARLQADDLILFVNDELIQSARMLKAELGQLEASDTLRLIVRRGAKLVSVEMPVTKKER